MLASVSNMPSAFARREGERLEVAIWMGVFVDIWATVMFHFCTLILPR